MRLIRRIDLAIAAAGAALFIVQWAGARPFWLDEEMIALNLRDRSVAQLATALSFDQAAPYAWLAIQRLVVLAAGTSELALRAVPVLFGLAALVAALWIGRRWMNAAGSAVLVLLCASGQWLTFYIFELKHYSADVLFALWLPALAAWAVEHPRRIVVWWIVAAGALWLSNGALFVTPACAIVLVAVAAARGGRRGLAAAAWPGVVWAASFSLHYVVSLQHALGSESLQTMWTFALPPAGGGFLSTIGWIGRQLVPLAVKPAGATFAWLLWVVAAAGVALATGSRRMLAWMFATVPVSAFVLAAWRIVPLYERLSLWIVPALYVGVALAADFAARQTSMLWRRTSVLRAACAIAVVVVCADVSISGLDLRDRPRSSNHQLDDRSAVRWLAARQRPGDVWMSTHFGLPAVWWYAADSGTAPAIELSYAPPGECEPRQLADVLKPFPRRLIYFGFRFDAPNGFDELLVDRLSELGAVTGFRRFDELSIALVIDSSQPSNRPTTLRHLDAQADDQADAVKRPPGCVGARLAAPW